jgi:hypothetical protein
MTIAVCLVVPDGVVFGTDSRSTVANEDRPDRYLNHEQKIFRIASTGHIGLLTWGRGRFGETSLRTAITNVEDEVNAASGRGLLAATETFAEKLWPLYQREVGQSGGASIGFCLGGCSPPGRKPEAYSIEFSCDISAPPEPHLIEPLLPKAWGWNIFIERSLGGDPLLMELIRESGKWSGTEDELNELRDQCCLPLHMPLSIREAADLVHSLVYATIKLHRFTVLPPVCGGLIQLAAMTADAPFSWMQREDVFAAVGST